MKGPYLSDIDERRFGIKTARVEDIGLSDLQEVLAFCNTQSVSLLIARCSTSNVRTVQALEAQGFFLTDTLLYYIKDMLCEAVPMDLGESLIRPFRPGEEDRVKAVAVQAFRGYLGHYHADPRLDPSKCDEVYASWAVQACLSAEPNHAVLVVEGEKSLNGFATLRLNSPEQGEGVLFAVAPYAQGAGLYRSLMLHGIEWCRSKGAHSMVVSTQINNIAVQKVWSRLGFEIHKAVYTLHKWFGQEGPQELC